MLLTEVCRRKYPYVYVLKGHVVCVRPVRGITIITLVTGDVLKVRESIDTIKKGWKNAN